MLTGKRRDRHRMNIWQSELDARLQKDGRVNNLYGYGDKSPILVKEYYSTRNTAEDGYRGTAPVAAFGPQNAFGFHNMMGNVWEWTATKWKRHPKAPPIEPNSMVKKGGSFLCNPSTCNRFRSSARMVFTADSAASNVGFRCAYSAEGPPPTGGPGGGGANAGAGASGWHSDSCRREGGDWVSRSSGGRRGRPSGVLKGVA
mmetsp:Transcript_35222/g.109684  ORF Transcript_35222/g.109684 Transcript_35222/m.109684 type:complete len:201 (+) Transcript_35222:453-1055(+)